MQGEPESPKAPLGNNFRPINKINHRVIRTNINFKTDQVCFFIKNYFSQSFKTKLKLNWLFIYHILK